MSTMRILKSGLVAAGLITALAAGSPARAQEHAPAQQPAAAAHEQPAADDAAAAEHGSGEAAHDESIWAVTAQRTVVCESWRMALPFDRCCGPRAPITATSRRKS